MGGLERIRTACRSCHGGCAVIAHVKDGKVTKVEGDAAAKGWFVSDEELDYL
jgi:anaerobic selenocysteine-containing dehydrogenase